MVIIFILGLGDMMAAISLFLLGMSIGLPSGIILFFSLYLILKGSTFIKDIASLMDIFGGILLLLSLSSSPALPSNVLIIAASLIGLKGVLSLISFS